MNSKLTGEITVTYIRGGIASKTGNPYLQVSNGRSEFFVNIPKGSNLVDANTFSDFSEDDLITLEVEVTCGSPNVKLLSIIQ